MNGLALRFLSTRSGTVVFYRPALSAVPNAFPVPAGWAAGAGFRRFDGLCDRAVKVLAQAKIAVMWQNINGLPSPPTSVQLSDR